MSLSLAQSSKTGVLFKRFFSHADLNDFESGGVLGSKKRRQVTAEQVASRHSTGIIGIGTYDLL